MIFDKVYYSNLGSQLVAGMDFTKEQIVEWSHWPKDDQHSCCKWSTTCD
jgi:hypothetical protein